MYMVKVVPLVGTWIETLLYAIYSTPFPSFPSWERGLKQSRLSRQSPQLVVVPLVGTWIETFRAICLVDPEKKVVPLVGTWIETDIEAGEYVKLLRRSPRGNVD